MFRKTHLILGKDLDEQLVKTLQVCGSYPLLKYVQKEKIKISPKIQLHLNQHVKCDFQWEALIDPSNTMTVDADGLDLMRKMLCVNPEERISVEEALKHPFLA
jgi:serine/threonine protein kinase